MDGRFGPCSFLSPWLDLFNAFNSFLLLFFDFGLPDINNPPSGISMPTFSEKIDGGASAVLLSLKTWQKWDEVVILWNIISRSMKSKEAKL